MCGIAGAYLKETKGRFPIREMTDILRHRGPDDEGYVLIDPRTSSCSERAGKETRPELQLESIEHPWPDNVQLIFGHRRLAIIDLSPAAHQPMTDRKRKFWITYNGEIYNYRELRSELEKQGSVFRSDSDTEVILEAYQAWGEDCLHKLNGMWAFALWDSEKKVLFCSRDRFGVKPFYYTQSRGNFYFASEIKALLELPGVRKEFSEEAVFDYLAFALHNRASRTFFSGICSLEPGTKLILDLSGEIQISRWYFFPENIGITPYSSNTPIEFAERLGDAVRLRLRSDVQVGSCLSGGLDSSSIVMLAARETKLPIQTFTSCFKNLRYDERKFVGAVMNKIKAHSHFVFPDGQRFWEEWPQLIYQQEEPFGSTSIYAQWCVMREAAWSKIPVLLDGQGGDELLAGYLRYRRNRAVGLLLQGDRRGFPLALANPKAFAFFGFHFMPPSLCAAMARSAAQCSGYLNKDFLRRHFDRTEEWVIERGLSQRNLSEALKSDFLDYSLPALLRYEDKNSMRFSVETRLPFLDYRLVEWVFGLEDAAKIDAHSTKRILREGMQGILPEEIRLRSDKMGFVTPEAEWLSGGASFLSELFRESSKSEIGQWIKTEKIARIAKNGGPWNQFIWRAINLELWMKVFFSTKSETNHENSLYQSVLSS